MSRRYISTVFLLTCILWGGCVQVSAAWTGSIPEKTTRQLKNGVKSWKYLSSNTLGVGASITTGSRKDTKRVTRTILYKTSGNKRNVNLDIEKRLMVRYEVYAEGNQKGKLYRLYKPTMTTLEKTCRYLKVFRLTTSTKSTLLDYGIDEQGRGVVRFDERTTFTLPQQFPLRRDGLTQLLRQAFKIDMSEQVTTYLVEPNGSFGRVSVSY